MPETTRREFIRRSLVAGSALTLTGTMACEGTTGSRQRHPNLIYVFPDQMRAQAQGFMGEDPVITPNLDRFATEGIVLNQAVSNYPVCSPYRAMLMTGMFPHSNGVLANCNTNGATNGYELRESSRCWSDVLREQGYSLGYIGKWHLDSPYKPYVDTYNNNENFAWNEWTPPHRRHSFDYWYAYGTYDNHNRPEYWTTDAPRSRRVAVDQWSPEHEADMAIRYIRNEGGTFRDPDRPFALVVGMNPPHTPYRMVPERYLQMYGDATPEELINRPNVNLKENSTGAQLARRQIRNYLAQVTGVDDQFGRILAELKATGLEEDTIVVFTSDHGNCLGCHDQVTKNVHYEESMRVPFIIRWNGTLKPRTDDLLISTPDIYPTLLDLMGFGPEIPEEVEGVSHAYLCLTGRGRRPASQLYMWVPYGEPALGRRGVRTHRYTLMISSNREGETEQVLHDNVNDPYQLRNIAGESRSIVQDLIESELDYWLGLTDDPWRASGV